MKLEEVKLNSKYSTNILPVLLSVSVLSISVVLWILNYFLGIVTRTTDSSLVTDGSENVSPSRWLLSIALPLFITAQGIKKKSLNTSGAVLAIFIGFFLALSSYCFCVSLLVFFFTSSRATKFRADEKRKFEDDFKEGGQRNWIQVFCNGGMAMQLSILYIMDVGFGQRPISFFGDYRASWLGIGILGALSCANGDTWASELGSVLSSSQPRLITTWRKVPKGTNGGVTLAGLFVSFMGGFVVGLGYYLVVIFGVDSMILAASPPQWPIIFVGGIGGLLGSIIDSYLGALFQYSGIDLTGKIKEIPSKDVRDISGFQLLDNHGVNLISTILTGLILPKIAVWIWPS